MRFLGKQLPRSYLSRAQLFGAPAVGRDLCRRPTGLALRLYELQQREVFDQPGRRVDDGRGRAPDARSVRVRYRRGLLLLSRRARAGAVELLGGARDGVVQADRQDHAGTHPRLRAERLADRRLGHLFRRHALARSAERAPSRRRELVAVRRCRPLAVRPDLERRRRERGRRRASAAGLYQLARRPDVQLPPVQARPQLHRYEPLERELLRADRPTSGPYRAAWPIRATIPSDCARPCAARRSRQRSVSTSILRRSAADDALRFWVFRKAPHRPRWVRSANASSSITSAAGSGPAASQLKMQSGSFGC